MKHGSLFSGIGGFELAAQWMDWENVFHCELNTFGQQILKYYWPKSISYEDITKTDFSIHRGKIDVLTGGFPCQPYSVAGKRKGKEDYRHLWPEMLRAIREIQPSWVVGENVRGIVNWNEGLVFEEVQTDLEAEGYEVTPFILPACAVNAPHRRDRVWFVSRLISNTISDGQQWDSKSQKGSERKSNRKPFNESDSLHEDGIITDSHCSMREGRESRDKTKEGEESIKKQSRRYCKFYNANFEEFPTQSPICDGDDGISYRLDAPTVFKGIEKPRKPVTFAKWRKESVKSGGNAIVPQVALQIFKSIKRTEDNDGVIHSG